MTEAIWSALRRGVVFVLAGPLLKWPATPSTVAPPRASILAEDGEERAPRSRQNKYNTPARSSLLSKKDLDKSREGRPGRLRS